MLCALIMAGGKGERFWPLSTEEKPKQFLNLLSSDSMLQMTVKRLLKLIPLDRIFIVTDKRYYNLVLEQLPDLPSRNVIAEPVGKNTAACIALSAFIIDKYFEDSTLLVVPSDHLVKDEERYLEVVKSGLQYVEGRKESIITLGIKPDRPETGYGYIKHGTNLEIINQNKVFNVECFVEKPNQETAEVYLKNNNYLWNSGMFIWNTKTIKSLFKQHLPHTFDVINEIATSIDTEKFQDTLGSLYGTVENISVDYAIMEKSDNIYVIPADFGWDDIGSWSSLKRYRLKDCNNNILSKNIKSEECYNVVALGDRKKIILLGVEDLFIIDTDNTLLIAKEEYLNNIKRIKKELNEK